MVESKTPANPLFLRDEELRQGIELMFYAYRDFTFESDQQLKRYQLGRAHHRALYFIGRHPGQTVGHLLSILKVTKQSISRVLKDLLEQGYVEQKSGARDRRERLLWLTEKGVKLERELTDRQSAALRPRLSRDRRRVRRGLPQGPAGPARSRRTRRRRQAGARQPVSVMDASADKPHILVVDDDTRLRELLRSFLSTQRLSRHRRRPCRRGARAAGRARLRPDRARRHDAGPDRAGFRDRDPALRRRADPDADRHGRHQGSHRRPGDRRRRLSRQAVRAARAAAAHPERAEAQPRRRPARPGEPQRTSRSGPFSSTRSWASSRTRASACR